MKRETLKEIKKARKWVAHYKQYRNEPEYAKKLRAWQRKLRKALKQAESEGLSVPPDPYAPPPPPPPPPPLPTEEELAEAALAELKLRVLLPWMAGPSTHAWSPWGDSGWSAVRIVSTARVRGRARRVNPRTGEEGSPANVRLDRLIKRDPTQKGKDRPSLTWLQVFGVEDPDPVEEEPIVIPSETPATASPPKTKEEQAAQLERVRVLFELLDDDSTSEDW